MFKKIKNWLEKNDKLTATQEYEDGFGWAMTEHFLNAKSVDIILDQLHYLNHTFDKGALEATRRIEKLSRHTTAAAMPEFECIPAWATWVAQDANGSWFAYENEPVPAEEENAFFEISGVSDLLHVKTPVNPNWISTKLKLKKERP